jgi:hypothetical protein
MLPGDDDDFAKMFDLPINNNNEEEVKTSERR